MQKFDLRDGRVCPVNIWDYDDDAVRHLIMKALSCADLLEFHGYEKTARELKWAAQQAISHHGSSK